MYLQINHASGYIEENDLNKYLIFDSTDENKELLKKLMMFLIELGIKSKSESADLTYYQRNRDVILNRAKDYYQNDKKKIKRASKR